MISILKKLHQFFWKYKRIFIFFVIITIISGIIENIRPYFYKILIDRAIAGQFDNFVPILVLYGGSWMVADVLTVLANYVGDRVVLPASADARVAIFKKVQDLDFAYHVEKNTGSMISAFKRGDSAFFNFYWILYREVLPIMVSIGVMFYFFAGVSIKFVVILTILMLVNGTISAVLLKKNLKKRQEFNDEDDAVAGIITDNLINYETVKFFAQEKQEEKRLLKRFEIWISKLYSYADTFRVIDLLVGNLSLGAMILVMILMINDLKSGSLTIGDFTMVTAFMGGFYWRFFGLIWNVRRMAKEYVDIDKYFAILDQKTVVVDGNQDKLLKKVVGRIEFKKVSFGYPGNKINVLKNVDLVINPGESVAFVGKSGAGKTTIVKLILRFYDVRSGQILVDGTDISKLSKSHLRSFMGIVPQEPVLFNNTIKFNIGYGNISATQKEIEKAAKMANLSSFIETLPSKYETVVGERGVKLSGGQKQRLAIARALLINPKILIFDEATSNLDSESEGKVQDALWKTAKDRTTLIIAHRFSTIKKADKIVVLDKGKVAEIGSHLDLVKKEGLYYKLWSMQFSQQEDNGIEKTGGGLLERD